MKRSPRSSVVGSRTAPEPAPAICRSGNFQFAANQSLANGQVQSRGILWCKSGHGSVRVNGHDHHLGPHDLLLLPWNRRIEYTAARTDPMLTAHVHLVPWLDPLGPWEANVPHEASEPLTNSPHRSDLPCAGVGGEEVVRLRILSESPTGRLIKYTTSWFRDSDRREDEGRALGLLWWREIERLTSRATPSEQRYPEELQRLMLHVERCFHESPNVEDLAGILGRSRSHVLKLFRAHLKISAKAFILNRQLLEARDLLLSTTMPINEVGRLSGFQDPYHFSKLFRRHLGMPPKEFRAKSGAVPVSGPPREQPDLAD